MNRFWGCRSGHRTVPHITLVPPFAAPDVSRTELFHLLDSVAASTQSFEGICEGFGAFGDRTVYARVLPDSCWDTLRASLYRESSVRLPGLLPPARNPFTPHITVANRDIPPGTVPAALEYFHALDFHAGFPVDHLTLFCRNSDHWDVAGSVNLLRD